MTPKCFAVGSIDPEGTGGQHEDRTGTSEAQPAYFAFSVTQPQPYLTLYVIGSYINMDPRRRDPRRAMQEANRPPAQVAHQEHPYGGQSSEDAAFIDNTSLRRHQKRRPLFCIVCASNQVFRRTESRVAL
jgi:hypothetical protein